MSFEYEQAASKGCAVRTLVCVEAEAGARAHGVGVALQRCAWRMSLAVVTDVRVQVCWQRVRCRRVRCAAQAPLTANLRHVATLCLCSMRRPRCAYCGVLMQAGADTRRMYIISELCDDCVVQR